MQVISGVNNSAFFAQSAYSAATATFDKNGNDIAETYYPTNNPSGFLTGVDLTPYQTKTDMTGYLTTAESANFYPSDNPSGFITGVDLSDYATTAELAGKQDAGDYLSASESANYYPMTGNPSGFLTEHQSLDGYLQDTDLTIVDNKITEISGVPLSAGGGGDVPEGVMAESGLEFNTDNEISGYNGSAFAVGGIPADAYTLSAGSGVEIIDDQVNKITTISVTSQAGNPDVEAYVQNTSADIDATIINVSSNSGVWGGSALPISAGLGVKLQLVNDTLVVSNDETVLWTGSLYMEDNATFTATEAPSAFETVKFIMYGYSDGARAPQELYFSGCMKEYDLVPIGFYGSSIRFNHNRLNFSNNVGTFTDCVQYVMGTSITTAEDRPALLKVIGINRK